jgi:hypothetical protein
MLAGVLGGGAFAAVVVFAAFEVDFCPAAGAAEVDLCLAGAG